MIWEAFPMLKDEKTSLGAAKKHRKAIVNPPPHLVTN